MNNEVICKNFTNGIQKTEIKINGTHEPIKTSKPSSVQREIKKDAFLDPEVHTDPRNVKPSQDFNVEHLNPSNRNSHRENDETTKKMEEKKKMFLLTVEQLYKHDLPGNFAAWSFEEQCDWLTNEGSKLLHLPESISNMLPSMWRPGDCGRAPTDKPDWLDVEMFRRGQKFAMDYMFGIMYANVLSLFLIFSADDGLKPMIVSNKSHTPYLAFKRYLSTAHRVRNWYTEDPWSAGTTAYNDIQIVRKMHNSMTRTLREHTKEEIDAASQISNPLCPMRNILLQDFNKGCSQVKRKCNWFEVVEENTRKYGLNQAEMVGTQFAFMGIVILYPKAFGIHYATEKDFESFCHLWRGIGYLLGIEDEYNFCRGSLTEVRARCRDYLEITLKPRLSGITPKWEHMTRCMVEGMRYTTAALSFNTALLYITDLLNMPMRNFTSKLSLSVRVMHLVNKFIFYFLCRFHKVRTYFNKLANNNLDRAVHFNHEKHLRLEERSKRTLLKASIT